MKKIQRKTLVIILVSLGIIFLLVSFYIEQQQSKFTSTLRLLIAQQETTITSIAEVTDRDGADAVVAGIVRDCDPEDREKFDTLLSTLNILGAKELKEVDQLFNACGSFHAERKALMIARLEREFEVYKDYIALLTSVDTRTDLIAYSVEAWEELISLEIQRSELSMNLVIIQKNIIDSLLKGAAINDTEITQQVNNAQEIQDTLSYLGVRIDTLREGILGL